jgi:hypothetical protein
MDLKIPLAMTPVLKENTTTEESTITGIEVSGLTAPANGYGAGGSKIKRGDIVEQIIKVNGHWVIEVTCPKCNEKRFVRKTRLNSGMCHKCSGTMGYKKGEGVGYKKKPVAVESLPGEIWRCLQPSPRRSYFVSNMGRVKSVTKNQIETLLTATFCKHKQAITVSCQNELGKNRPWELHLLVAHAFVPNHFSAAKITFLDGDKTNCKSENLAWGNAISREQQIQNFTDATDVKRTHPGIVDNVIQYVLTHDDKALNAAWTESLRVFRGTAYNGLFKRSGWKHIPCQELVSDIVQEALLKAQVAIRTGRLKNPRNIEGWLSRIVNNTAVTYGLKNHHISSAVENGDGEEFNMSDILNYDANYAYTPAWGIM